MSGNMTKERLKQLLEESKQRTDGYRERFEEAFSSIKRACL